MNKYFFITLILCAAFALTACGGAESSPASQPTASPEAPAQEPESVAWAPDGPVTMIVAY